MSNTAWQVYRSSIQKNKGSMHIVITGASAGIGLAAARLFAKKGYQVTALARRLEPLEALSKEFPGLISPFSLDVSNKKAVETTFASLKKPIDVLINNAGAAFGVDLAQSAKIEDFEKCVDINIKGLLYCTHCTLPEMVKRNIGHIINLGSVAGSYPYPGGNVYGATKAFVHQFSLNLLADLLGTAVRVSCIEPGLVGGTEFSEVRFKGDKQRAHSVYEKTKPLTAEDIAETIFFCVNAPAHVNINHLEVMPVMQAFNPLAVYREPS